MAREFVIWCDPCMGEDQRTPGNEQTITINGKPRVLAICQAHNDQLVKPLQAVLDEYGETPEVMDGGTGRGGKRPTAALANASGKRHGKSPRAGRPNQCLWCDLSYSADGGGFARHLKTAHGFAGLVEAFGGTCPICGDGEFEQMANHVNRQHPEFGFVAVAQPFTWARDNGDPHGVYAEKLQQVGSLDPDKAWEETRAAEQATLDRMAEKVASGGN